jgi:hypothetical protein
VRIVQGVPAAVDAHDRQAAERRQPGEGARVEQAVALALTPVLHPILNKNKPNIKY